MSKIYTEKEFNFTQTSIKNINFNSLPKQQLIVLNELNEIPQTLIASLTNYIKNGGYLIIIPNSKISIPSYNLFLKNISAGKIISSKTDTLKITNINFNHPLLKNVFTKSVQNFQYPTSKSHYTTNFKNASNIISYENNLPFIQQIKNKKIYFVSSSLELKNSNFINSPLVVPTFYNIGQQSLKHSKPYYTVNYENKIDINTQLNKDEIVTIKDSQTSFIPLQQTFQNKVIVTTNQQPTKAGFYHILKQNDTLKTIAFNYPKEESLLHFLNINELKNKNNITISTSVKDVFKEMKQKNKVRWLWQWFLALAIVSLLLEILILKFFKV